MPIRKIWDHVIDIKEEFVPRREKIYFFSNKKRGDTYVH